MVWSDIDKTHLGALSQGMWQPAWSQDCCGRYSQEAFFCMQRTPRTESLLLVSSGTYIIVEDCLYIIQRETKIVKR